MINIGQSFWLDEAIGALVVKKFDLTGIVTQFMVSDNHPPLYYMMLEVWTYFVGLSELGLRSMSVLAGVISVFVVYLITKNKWAALLLATAPLHVYYSQEARMYVFVALFATLAVYFYLKQKYLFYGIAIALMMFSDYMPLFILPVFWIDMYLRKSNKQEWSKFIASHLFLIVLGIFWLPMFFKQINTGRQMLESLPEWSKLAGGATFKNLVLLWTKFVFGRISFYPKEIYYLTLILSSIPILFLLFKALNVKNKFYWLWLVAPVVLSFVASFVFPGFNYFRLIYVLPAFYILISSVKSKLLWLVLIVNFLGLGIYYMDPNQSRENWRQAVAFVSGKIKEDESVILNYPGYFAPYEWYSKDLKTIFAADKLLLGRQKTIDNLTNETDVLSGVYYFNYLEDLTDPERAVYTWLVDNGYKVSNEYQFIGVGSVKYLTK